MPSVIQDAQHAGHAIGPSNWRTQMAARYVIKKSNGQYDFVLKAANGCIAPRWRSFRAKADLNIS